MTQPRTRTGWPALIDEKRGGQEAVSAGVVGAMAEDDYLFVTGWRN